MNTLLLFLLIFCIPACSMDNSGKQERLDIACDEKLIAPFVDDGVACLKNGQLAKLDPLVGETACHIRAVRVADLYDRMQDGGALTDRDKLLVGSMYMLTKARVIEEKGDGYDELIDTKILKPLSNQKAKNAVKNAQRFVAADSVNYIRDIAQQMSDVQRDDVVKALSVIRYTESPFCRPSLACFPSVLTLVERTRIANRPIVLRYGATSSLKITEQQLFVPNKTGTYVPGEFSALSPKQSTLVIEGISAATPMEIKALNPAELFLMGASLHGQFAGKINKDFDIPYKELNIEKLGSLKTSYAEKAKNCGVTGEKQSLFFIEHIFAGTLGEFKK